MESSAENLVLQSFRESFLGILGRAPTPSEEQGLLIFFREFTLENKVQNLSRLLDPVSFHDGHVLDVLHLEKSGFLGGKVMDLGSGGGVPGLLHQMIFKRSWILCDSEKRKAEFLQRMITDYPVENALVVNIRAEEWLSSGGQTDQISARAVGTVEKIYSWIRKCSTWNKLILLKGPGWEEEWKKFSALTKKKNPFQVIGEYRYEVGIEKKQRVIIHLERKAANVLRGT